MLEWARVLTWRHRIARIRVRERDLFGQWASRWRVIRTSNAYVLRYPPLPRLPSPRRCARLGGWPARALREMAVTARRRAAAQALARCAAEASSRRRRLPCSPQRRATSVPAA